jgi:hypothetical protein
MFLFREGALGGAWKIFFEGPARWLGGMSPAPHLPPVDRAGGTHFSNFSQPAPLFGILIFFKPFFKKNSPRREGSGPGWVACRPSAL